MYAIGNTLKPLRRLTLSGTRLTTKPDCESRFSTLHCAQSPVRGHGSDWGCVLSELVGCVVEPAVAASSCAGFSPVDPPQPTTLRITAATKLRAFCFIAVKDN